MKQNRSYFTARCQADNAQGMWANLFLDLLVTGRNTFKCPDILQSTTSSVRFVGQHAAHCSLEDLSRSTVVKGSAGRVDVTPLAKESQELQLVTAK